MLVEMFSLQYCLLLISLLEQRTEKKRKHFFFHFVSHKGFQEGQGGGDLSCGSQQIETAYCCPCKV